MGECDKLITDNEKIIIEVKEKDLRRYIDEVDDRLEIVIVDGHMFGVAYSSRDISIVGNTICKMNPRLDYVILINMEKDTYSFRAIKDDVDVSVIAKRLGGGGHRLAAGAPISKSIKYDIMTDLLCRLRDDK